MQGATVSNWTGARTVRLFASLRAAGRGPRRRTGPALLACCWGRQMATPPDAAGTPAPRCGPRYAGPAGSSPLERRSTLELVARFPFPGWLSLLPGGPHSHCLYFSSLLSLFPQAWPRGKNNLQLELTLQDQCGRVKSRREPPIGWFTREFF